MTCIIHILPLWSKNITGQTISTVSKHSQLSPFRCGPCKLYAKFISQNMENGWQFAKIYYPQHFILDGKVSQKRRLFYGAKYWPWAEAGWNDSKAHRYPMGKGRKPEFSYWDGDRLDYVTARKRIYVPLYAKTVQKTDAWKELKQAYRRESEITLLDYDAYDHLGYEMSLTKVLNDPSKKMGHAFVLAMLLQNDSALDQCDL